jgi:purine nucleosidase
MPRPVIIDCDPGIDDAVAILLALASPDLAIEAIVAVAGNAPLAATSRNACAVLELAGRGDVPVYVGCPRPIGPLRPDAAYAHGHDGLGDLILPEPAIKPRSEHGVLFLIKRLRTAGPRSITLCALGPLTNIAAALVLAPDIVEAVADLVIMGGGTHGNITPAAEFNMHCDPNAAAIVFDSGVPITLVPLDVTEAALGTAARIAPIAERGTRCCDAAAILLGPRRALGRPPMAMHDACVVAWLVAPELFAAVPAAVSVETRGRLTAGMTVIRPVPNPPPPAGEGRVGAPPPNARVLTAADVDGLFRLLAERIASLP